MFRIDESRFGEFTQVKVLDAVTGAYFTVIPEYGGNINELVLVKNEKEYSIIEGESNYSDLVNNMAKTYRSAKLIPFPNRIKDGHYRFNGNDYQLPINEKSMNNSLHGFFFDKKMDITHKEAHDNRASISLEYVYDGSVSGYPFLFKLRLVYILDSKEGFECITEVTNVDQVSLPVGDGWHPFFKTGGKVDELMLQLPTDKKIMLDARMIPTGEVEKYDKFSAPQKIGNMEFDNTFYVGDQGGRVATFVRDTENDLTINIWQDTKSYRYLQIYIPPERTSIAVEPMTCNVNSFNNNEGLIILEPGESFKASYGVILQ